MIEDLTDTPRIRSWSSPVTYLTNANAYYQACYSHERNNTANILSGRIGEYCFVSDVYCVRCRCSETQVFISRNDLSIIRRELLERLSEIVLAVVQYSTPVSRAISQNQHRSMHVARINTCRSRKKSSPKL
ncbi:hypothetical protein LSAT2_002442 [Lamellibrachia satsuma]|nr:hypothetical protein LSAT2_002442 [Lamellibrachia satsuma]